MPISKGPAAAEWRAHWPLVAATTAAMSLASMLTAAFGILLAPIEEDLGWSRAEITTGPLVVSVTGILLATPAGFLIDRLGARRIGIFVVVAICAAVALMGSVGDHLWQWWLLWALFGLAAAANPAVWLSAISSRFHAGRGLAIAVTLCGTGISMALVPIIALALIESYGWRFAVVALAAVWGVITLPLILLFFRGANEAQGRRRGSAQPESAPVPQHELPGFTVRQGFASVDFWKLLVATLALSIGGTALVLNLVPVLDWSGLSRAEAAGVAGVFGFASIGGRLLGGWLLDRFPVRIVAALAVLSAIALPLGPLLFPGSVAAAMAAVLTYGLAGGATMPAIAYLTSRHFGPRSFGTLYGAISTATAVSVGVGPMIANGVYDLTQSYEAVMWGTIPAFGLSALLFLSLGRYRDFAENPAR